MPGFNFVAIHKLTAEITIGGVQTDAMMAGYQGDHFFQVASQLFDSTGFTRVVAGCLYPTRQFSFRVFKSRYIICLPAVNGDGELV